MNTCFVSYCMLLGQVMLCVRCDHPVKAPGNDLARQAFANEKRFRGIRTVIVPLLQWQVGASGAMRSYALSDQCILYSGLLSIPTVFEC